MKIWLVSSEYPTIQNHLKGIFVFDQAKALQSAGHEVLVLVLDLRSILRKRKMGRFSYSFQNVKYEVISFPLGNVPYFIFDGVGVTLFNKLYKDLTAKLGKPDVLHAHFYDMAAIVARSKLKNVPFLITEHSSFIHKMETNSRLWRRMQKTYIRADQVIAVSQSLANTIEGHFHVDVQMIPNIVDLSIFQLDKFQLKEKKDKFLFISTGNLVPIKNMELLINTFSGAFFNNKKIELIINGDGEDKVKLDKLIDELEMRDNIHLNGQVSRSKLAELYKSADAFVLVSSSETFGLAYVEALASGLPVIATRCGGPEDFVNDTNGLLIKPNDYAELIQALHVMIEIAQKFDRQAISDKISRMYSAKNIVIKLERCYTKVLADNY